MRLCFGVVSKEAVERKKALCAEIPNGSLNLGACGFSKGHLWGEADVSDVSLRYTHKTHPVEVRSYASRRTFFERWSVDTIFLSQLYGLI